MSNILCGPSNKLGTFFIYSHIQGELGNLGGIVLPALCTIIIVHPNIIPYKHRYVFLEPHETTYHKNTGVQKEEYPN